MSKKTNAADLGHEKNSAIDSAKIEKNLWDNFAQQNKLNSEQISQFQKYYKYFIQYNKLHNLTAITDLSQVLNFHFSDSLALEKLININNISSLADVGSGGGFPGIPLKIKYPHLSLILIEVNQKKQQFLKDIISMLTLTNCVVSSYDWRTFLRQTNYPIDIFCARASLQPEELIRIFKASSPYKNSKLVYWASEKWQAEKELKSLISKEVNYTIVSKKDSKNRKLVLFENLFFN